MTASRGNAFLKQTHFIRQVRLVANSRGHTAEQSRNFRTCLSKAEDVIDKEQHILVLHIAEVFRHSQAGECHTQTSSRGFIHLSEDKGSIFQNPCFFHLNPQVVTFTGTLTNAGEHRGTTEVARHTGNHFLNQHCLTNASTTEQTDLTTLNVRGEQVDRFNTSL